MGSFNQSLKEIDVFLDFIEEDMENVRRVRDFCRRKSLDVEFTVHPKAETCEESAHHSDMEIDQIVKTLVFKTGKEFIAVLAPGDSRVDMEKLREITGEEDIRMANPEEVEDETGYVVGGVSPFDLEISVYMEENLLEHDKIRPAAGSRVIGSEVRPEDLHEAIGAELTKLT